MTPKTESESPPPPETMEVSLPVSLDLKKERPPKEDIQNKLNKFCSVCQVRRERGRNLADRRANEIISYFQENFESRKMFIEHCQVVHGMKFKTKSGISIPPPTPTAGVKRKLDNGNDCEW